MIRVETQMSVRLGHFNQVLEISQQLNELARANGWTESRFWIAETGPANTFVVESDFASMADYERESEATYASEEWMKLIRASIDHVIEGSVVAQIYREAQAIA